MRYPVEEFTKAERERLVGHFTNLESPVFALVNLPETVKGAMFARYSRYGGTLRRLFLDEFADTVPKAGALELGEGDRARELYERIFFGYGDDSVAQLGGAHIGCEWVSNLLTKILQRHRIASYLEQSTRYIPFDAQVDGLGYRYYREAEFGPEFVQAMDSLFATYSAAFERVASWADKAFPRSKEESDAAHARAVRAKALDIVRGLLPAASMSHVGIYASGQTYEQLVMHLMAHPLREAQEFGEMLLTELEKVIPSFLARVRRPERGGKWIEYLSERSGQAERASERLGLDDSSGPQKPGVRLLSVDGTEEALLVGLVYEHGAGSYEQALQEVHALPQSGRDELLAQLLGGRGNRRHRPGRGLETIRYKFEVVSDYGAFRDLQRHRMLTAQWQRLSPDLGATVPAEVDLAGFGDEYRRALERSRAEYERLRMLDLVQQAPYALALAFRIRYLLEMNAREAMHLIELRSAREGHPAYRVVAQQMHQLIESVHPGVARAISFVDHSAEERLERLPSELRSEAGGQPRGAG